MVNGDASNSGIYMKRSWKGSEEDDEKGRAVSERPQGAENLRESARRRARAKERTAGSV